MNVTKWPHGAAGDDWSRRNQLRVRELQNAWGRFLGRVRWRVFVTLTFDPKKTYPVDKVKANKEAFWWCGETGRVLRRPLGWIYAPERGPCGQWHVHALIIGADAGDLEDVAPMWRRRNGRIDCRPVIDCLGVTLYATKEAALTGEIVWSDTLPQYLSEAKKADIVGLHP
jgi:hypothetical protein